MSHRNKIKRIIGWYAAVHVAGHLIDYFVEQTDENRKIDRLKEEYKIVPNVAQARALQQMQGFNRKKPTQDPLQAELQLRIYEAQSKIQKYESAQNTYGRNISNAYYYDLHPKEQKTIAKHIEEQQNKLQHYRCEFDSLIQERRTKYLSNSQNKKLSSLAPWDSSLIDKIEYLDNQRKKRRQACQRVYGYHAYNHLAA